MKKDLHNKIDQIPYLGLDIKQFEKVVKNLGYTCEIYESGTIVSLQARPDNVLVVFTKENKVETVW